MKSMYILGKNNKNNKIIENKEKDRWKSLKLWFVNLLIIEYQYVRIYTLKYKGWECRYGNG